MNGHSIPLPSGKIFDYLNPTPTMIDIHDIAMSLSKLCRFNGYCDGFYTVAQHSCIGAEYIDEAFAFEFLLHDAAEAYCNDIVSPFKRLLGDYKVIEGRVDAAIRIAFNLPTEMSPAVKAMDDSMYWTERYSLCPYYDGAWKSTDDEHKGIGKRLPGIFITPLDGWIRARERFLDSFYRYAPYSVKRKAA